MASLVGSPTSAFSYCWGQSRAGDWWLGRELMVGRLSLDPTAAETEDHHRFCAPENRSLHDGEEPLKFAGPLGFTYMAWLPPWRTSSQPLLLDRPDEIGAFHAAGRVRASRITSAPCRDCSDRSRFASSTMATASL